MVTFCKSDKRSLLGKKDALCPGKKGTKLILSIHATSPRQPKAQSHLSHIGVTEKKCQTRVNAVSEVNATYLGVNAMTIVMTFSHVIIDFVHVWCEHARHSAERKTKLKQRQCDGRQQIDKGNESPHVMQIKK